MRRQAFLLGLFATGSQTLILRELVSTLNGSELFIGTALFGWLVWVALGAYLGGKLKHLVKPGALFLSGSVLLPVVMALCRLSPLVVTNTVGELIPFSVASLISILAALPHGFMAGMLFPTIARGGDATESTILRVYLIEGIGACVAGVGVTLVAGYWLSNLSTATLFATVVVVGAVSSFQRRYLILSGSVSLLAALILLSGAVETVERELDRVRYPGYEIVSSFDTPYTHEALLERDSAYVLMTDNTVEANYPDIENAENLLLPARAYLDTFVRALLVGWAEPDIASLTESIGEIEVTSVDQRDSMIWSVGVKSAGSGVKYLRMDIIKRLSPEVLNVKQCRLNAIIVPLGDLSSFRTSRLLYREKLARFAYLVGDNGLLVILTRFDTDRYATPVVGDILGTIRNELTVNFRYVAVWPGTSTLFLASNTDFFSIPNDTLFARLSRLPYQPQFVHEMYLRDRLNEFKVAGLVNELSSSSGSHTIDKPTLVMKQALYRAHAYRFDRLLATAIFEHRFWLLIFPVAMLGLLSFSVSVPDRRRFLGLPLYVTAGFTSFVIELLIFYLYQANIGSLHAELAALIGVFMLGLACGTFLGTKRSAVVVERASLALLAISVLALLRWNSVWPILFAPYSFVLIFLTALATGGLFVAATHRYYAGRTHSNRGVGYAVEISGSAIGALLATTVLLPTIGLSWILISCLILIGLAALASVIVPPVR